MTTLVVSSNGKLDKNKPDKNKHETAASQDENDSLFIARRRAKVYILKDGNWIDHGTGFCSGEIDIDNKPYFIVHNELDVLEVILKAYLEGNTTFQRQQNTLIVWTDIDGNEIALLFQEIDGCVDLCDFIVKVQQENYLPDISLYYIIRDTSCGNDIPSEITELITGPVAYPLVPTMYNLEQVLDVLNLGSTVNYYKSCIAQHVIQTNFVLQLIDIFHQSETGRNLINLYILSEIIKTLILYGDLSIVDNFLITESCILGVIGILEYDAEFPNQKSSYREFLKRQRFQYILDMPNLNNEEMNVFKKDYYLNFLKDILSKFIDDQTFSALDDSIFSNQNQVIEFLKDSNISNNFLSTLFGYYKQEGEVDLKRNGVRLIHQYITSTRNTPGFQRNDFVSLLTTYGLFDMIRFALNETDTQIRTSGMELIESVIKQDMLLVKSVDEVDPILEGDSDKAKATNEELRISDDITLMTLLSQVLLTEDNFGIKTQAFEALKNLLDVNIGKMDENGTLVDPHNKHSNDINTQDHFEEFYNKVAPILYGDIIKLAQDDNDNDNDNDKPDKSLVCDQLLYQQLCELFSYCVSSHDKKLQRQFFISNKILLGMMRLLEIDCKLTLKLSVITCLYNIISANDKFYQRFILNHGLIDKFFRFFETVNHQNNLANSTCLSLLEVLSEIGQGKFKPVFKELIKHIVDNYKETLMSLESVNTGAKLVSLYETLNLSSWKQAPETGPGELPTDKDIGEDGREFYDDSDDDNNVEPSNSHAEHTEHTDEYDQAFFDDLRYDYEDRHLYGDDLKQPETRNLFAEIQKDIDFRKRMSDLLDLAKIKVSRNHE